MDHVQYQRAILNLYRAHSRLLQEYAECMRRDDIFEVKRKLLLQMREIEKDIETLQQKRPVLK
jgi:hypothetical protein